jgi:hypothetical protein
MHSRQCTVATKICAPCFLSALVEFKSYMVDMVVDAKK